MKSFSISYLQFFQGAVALCGTLLVTTALAGCDGEVEPIEWNSNANSHRQQVNQKFTYRCPAGGNIGTVWGTDIYTDDSSICSAAVHAGKITVEKGGTVTIKMLPGQSSYSGSTRNGVSTNNYDSWAGSYQFVN